MAEIDGYPIYADEVRDLADQYGTTVAVIEQAIRDGWDPDFEVLDLDGDYGGVEDGFGNIFSDADLGL